MNKVQNQFDNNYWSNVSVALFWNDSCGNLQQFGIIGTVFL